jgi:NhaP-type Na+/H+ and K+/H+ antiporter
MTFAARIEAVCGTEAGPVTAYSALSGRSIRAVFTKIADQLEVDFGQNPPDAVFITISRTPNGPA